jgi:hypothetical protein
MSSTAPAAGYEEYLHRTKVHPDHCENSAPSFSQWSAVASLKLTGNCNAALDHCEKKVRHTPFFRNGQVVLMIRRPSIPRTYVHVKEVVAAPYLSSAMWRLDALRRIWPAPVCGTYQRRPRDELLAESLLRPLRVSVVILHAVESEAFHTSPKRKRGKDLWPSLTLRASVSFDRVQYNSFQTSAGGCAECCKLIAGVRLRIRLTHRKMRKRKTSAAPSAAPNAHSHALVGRTSQTRITKVPS